MQNPPALSTLCVNLLLYTYMAAPIRFIKGKKIQAPLDLRQALDANKKAKAVWEDITDLAQTEWIFWVVSGKKAETRQIRIAKAISKLSGGMRRPCCFAGIMWES